MQRPGRIFPLLVKTIIYSWGMFFILFWSIRHWPSLGVGFLLEQWSRNSQVPGSWILPPCSSWSSDFKAGRFPPSSRTDNDSWGYFDFFYKTGHYLFLGPTEHTFLNRFPCSCSSQRIGGFCVILSLWNTRFFVAKMHKRDWSWCSCGPFVDKWFPANTGDWIWRAWRSLAVLCYF